MNHHDINNAVMSALPQAERRGFLRTPRSISLQYFYGREWLKIRLQRNAATLTYGNRPAKTANTMDDLRRLLAWVVEEFERKEEQIAEKCRHG